MNVRKWAATAFASVLATAGLVTATASGANAWPTECSYQLDPIPGEHGISSYCSSGTYQHRAVVMESHHYAGILAIDSPWVPAGQTSYTRIPYHPILSIRIDTR